MFEPFVLTVYCCVVVLESCLQSVCADCTFVLWSWRAVFEPFVLTVYCCVVDLESYVRAIYADCVLLCCGPGELCSSHLC